MRPSKSNPLNRMIRSVDVVEAMVAVDVAEVEECLTQRFCGRARDSEGEDLEGAIAGFGGEVDGVDEAEEGD